MQSIASVYLRNSEEKQIKDFGTNKKAMKVLQIYDVFGRTLLFF